MEMMIVIPASSRMWPRLEIQVPQEHGESYV